MYGTDPACVFLVFCNPGEGGAEALDHWYMKIHGPDALENGSFQALHRYQAADDSYPSRFLAVWEGSFTTMDEARAYIAPRAAGLRAQGRVTEDMTVNWALMAFRANGTSDERLPAVSTVTLVEGARPGLQPPPGRTYDYGDIVLHESAGPADEVKEAWAGAGQSGPAPRGVYHSIFDGGTVNPPVDGTWVSFWRPIGSLTLADLGLDR
jgi:hypothetical protein